jgi:hypothetical protein
LSRRFETLAKLPSATLESLFARGRVAPLSGLSGRPPGRVLAIPGFDRGLVGGFLRRLHASPLFPWEGKSFSAGSRPDEGRGENRLRFPRGKSLFAFRTYATDSLVDGHPCVAIDYDVPENPRFVRPTYDELRRVAPGLYLGRGMRRRQGREPKLLLWFAVDTGGVE